MTVSDILKRENNNLDLVRIIVATMVIWSHSFALNFGNGSGEPLFKFVKVTYAGELGVNIFFFISGLLVTNSLIKKKSISKFFISRFFRLFPALVTLLFITVFVIGPIVSTLSVKEYFLNFETWKYLISNLYLKIIYALPGCFQNNIWPSDVNGSLWSLPFEVGCYVFLVAVFSLLSGSKKFANIIIGSIIFLAIVPNDMLLTFFERKYILGLVPIACFAFGAFFAVNQDKIKIDFKLMLGFMLLLLIFWRYQKIIHILFPFVISIFMLFFSTDKFILKLKPKYDISYGLYIWHFLVQQTLFFYYGQLNVYVFFLISFSFTSIISLFSYILIEHKSIDFGYKLGKRVNDSTFNFDRILVFTLFLFIVIILAKVS
ncbi:MAG: acyltransferase [Paludibacter sp.]|nr:acyltransferase [Paludibacter sp.]